MDLTSPMLHVLESSVLCWLATCDESGCPNVSPKEVFVGRDNAILIAHIASPKSVANIRSNPHVAVAAIDVFDQTGWKFTGTARVVTSTSTEWSHLVTPLRVIAGPDFPIKAVIEVQPHTANRIVAPSTWVFGDRDLRESRARVLARYGVVESCEHADFKEAPGSIRNSTGDS